MHRSIRRLARWLLPVSAVGALLLFVSDYLRSSWLKWPLASGIACASLILFWMGAELYGARTRRNHYRSGDSRRVRVAVEQELTDGDVSLHLHSLAMAGLGDFSAARRALLNSAYLNAEDQELSLCAHILISSFEGEATTALGLCRRLMSVPLGGATGNEARRLARRAGIVALARAVSGSADETDYRALLEASVFEPSLYWAVRYGAAISCYAKREPELAYRLVADAPRWPVQSVFRALHLRILAGVASGARYRAA